jgi:hypothetical protein
LGGDVEPENFPRPKDSVLANASDGQLGVHSTKLGMRLVGPAEMRQRDDFDLLRQNAYPGGPVATAITVLRARNVWEGASPNRLRYSTENRPR